ncbi:MAG: pknD [Candidatus Solibacter sp.]|nr:pknD [Candidatus Solibacter sp.]
MDRAAERWATVRALLGEALEFDAAAQPRYLETIEDATLREEVRAYLAWVPAGPDPLDQQPWGAAIIPAGVAEGSRVTNYRLLKELGSGGMGTVYLAERDDREFEQRVAIKVIQRGLRSDEMIRLFRQERQILASLNHPSIARLVDGGVTEDGRPFFVMEYVDGVPIDVYCGLHDLNIRERLRLFLLVCSAVQAAHQSLIVHRDLKPANILVTADCIPKLLDFGVAGLFGEQGRSPGTMGMTPRYASPEHARGEVSGAATDIYSLGVLLFELLTGSPPLAQGESRTAFLRALQEDAPRRPSDIAAGGAQRRTLRGDLDQIVLHALEKLPAGRYPSVESFAADIRRYLEGFPVLANTASWRYRAGKFIRRHRTLVAAGTALTIVAGLSFAAVLRSARIAERQHALAELRFEQGRELARFYMLEVDRLLERLPGSTPARALITGHTLAYIDRLAPGAVGDVSLQREFATAYERVALTQGMPQFANLGDRPGALGNVQKALRIRRQILTLAQATLDDRIAYGDALMLLGHLTLSGGSPASAIEVYLQGAREFEAVRARSPHPAGRLYNRISGAYLYAAGAYSGGGFTPDTGDLDAALPLYDKAVRLMPLERKAREGQAPALRLYLDSNEALMEESWAIALANVLRYGEADRHFEAALRLIHAPGIDSANAEILRKEGSIAIYYANALVDRGELARARPLLAVSERIFSGLMKSDPENIISKADVVYLSALQGRVEIAGGQVAAGLALLEQAIGQEEEVRARGRGFEESGGFLSRHWMWSAEGWMAAKQAGRARVRYGQVLELAGAIMRQHPDDVNTRLNVAAAELGMGRALAAEWDAAGAVRHRGLAAEAASAVLAAHPKHLRARAMLAEAKGL